MPALRKRFPLDLAQDEKSSTKLFVDPSVNNLWKWDRRDLRTNEVDTIGLVFHTRDIALDFAVCVSNLPGRSRCSSEMNAAMRINFSINQILGRCVLLSELEQVSRLITPRCDTISTHSTGFSQIILDLSIQISGLNFRTDTRKSNRTVLSDTYGHRIKKARIPVRSFLDKLDIGGVVVGWVTTSEFPLLYVVVFLHTPPM
ncbi:hypothetical protein E6O75_ATG02528 [Venturia nashicola]|uniref:Uncharacterized protein n=1 Tax=Venturia nashicola TaxID=86259 RepID=A0A4Z1P5B2_9PEZI|nr:hypothetical protein E6O75_ATG02528 [Venturia nashicola]